jgi:hypothetical protein
MKNIGNKLQGLGKVILYGGGGLSIAVWIYLQIYISRSHLGWDDTYILISAGVLIFGVIGSIISGLVLNGFGTLINNTVPKPSPADPLPTPEVQ